MQPLHLSHRSSPPVEERLLQYGRLYNEKLQQAQAVRRQQEEAAAAEVARPTSPLHPRCLFAPTPSLHANAEVARRRRAKRLAEYIAERETQQSRHPAILPASRNMAAALRQREQWEGLSVGELLHARQKVHEERMEEKRREEAAKLTFRPAVSEHTKRLKVSEPVVERLYAPRHTTVAATSSPAKKCGAVLADVTNRHNSSVSMKPTSASAATYQRLYHDAVSRRTHSETQDKLKQVRSSSAFRPQIDPISSLIASQSEDTVHARLIRSKAPPDSNRYVNPEETFAPRTNRTATSQKSHNSLPRRSEMWLRRRGDRLRHFVKERHEAEMRECTFHPRTNRGPASSCPWGMSDSADTPLSSSADLIESTEELLSHIGLDEPALFQDSPQQDSSPHWADVLRSTVPDDLLDLLEEAELTSYDSRRPSLP
ncbi:hypothetical protein ABB37_07858 [Leptomonas pyrrhocoris]|uniref:Uncharacterized protein n=1 Tax=Leptomonas pyrrhocoris TaxID=157538 RepID=A0A0N1J4G9_LEPPY|nr:hypothetical protein ABB37_07858 [Leptomonas pyrrhocoris]KPA76574.1 hypothetical protein ABB37_07858 [Leptomonas pyrrhocoris]|eukprot:XP_015655013.1 hypothetical protein ABB37_07858 [Leptomonas pyrrhocoris]